ncbi:hypothetical protein FJV46_04230 [Arthrobacter agilis]|uniref:hypothetical protein n=1 Tax=Arthrobacter agilis TaxID=37921 RepID=UPI000B35EF2C|nr:hypothetical protein [Arthrobacter agilis]OUM41389.1 hypothetical protein B8W74_10810 [Arthrobacter agilis]PPB46279.1 hypothetical protein CI784_08080 [Arthrobacter agilis]TPV27036.1 hypothetical protein FJV46_04230 [Arthrobacter agilis]
MSPRQPSAAVRRRRRRLRTGAMLTALAAVVVGGSVVALGQLDRSEILVRERCSATVGPDTFELTPEQTGNAALISGVAVNRGLPARAASIAIATAIQESRLENIDYGDDAGPDSRGLFQQRPSQGWGTEEQVMTPLYATSAFYDALVQVPGYETLPITEAAQTVQRSAYPEAYADHEPEGRAFASALTGNSPASMNCTLRAPTGAGDALAVSTAADEIFGPLGGAVDGTRLTLDVSGTLGWATAQWAVANASMLHITSVAYSGLAWDRAEGGWSQTASEPGVLTVEVAGVTP